jgi:hypothetical protein
LQENNNGAARAWQEGKQQQELPSARSMGGLEEGRQTEASAESRESQVRHYVLIDGVLTLSTPDVARWLHRVNKAMPPEEERADAEAISEARLTAWEILEGLDEIE